MDKFFKISERGSNVRTEIIAGLTTFFAMAYIIIVNPNQMIGFSFDVTGADKIWNAVYIASILGAFIGTILYSLYAKLPFAQACGMGLNSFFFTSFVLPQIIKGGDVIKGYQAGLVIILVSGLIFLVLSVTGARSYIAKAMPDCIKKAIPAGIGLFIAFIGFQNVGIIQANQYTLVQFVKINGAKWADIAPAIIALLGFIIIAILSKLKVKGSVLVGILATSVIYYLATWTLPAFDISSVTTPFKDFAEIGITAVFQADSWKNAFSGEMLGGIFSVIMLIVTFCLVDMFDTIGTLYGTASEADMLDENGDPIDIDKSMACDSIATVSGAVCGTSTVTTFVESGAGISAGGKTGLTALTAAILFLLSIVLYPLIASIPGPAAASALLYVGCLMLKGIKNVNVDGVKNYVPAFLTIAMMPLAYSITDGIGFGILSYVLIDLISYVVSAIKYAITKKDEDKPVWDLSVVTIIIAVLFIVYFFVPTTF